MILAYFQYFVKKFMFYLEIWFNTLKQNEGGAEGLSAARDKPSRGNKFTA
jgi:hypothetical protein